jgi:hypothetical protein
MVVKNDLNRWILDRGTCGRNEGIARIQCNGVDMGAYRGRWSGGWGYHNQIGGGWLKSS